VGPPGPSNFQVFTADGTFTVPSGVNTIQIEAVGAGGPGGPAAPLVPGGPTAIPGGGGGGSGAYQKVVLGVVSGATYAVTVGVSGGLTTTIVKDQTGRQVACGAGGEAGLLGGPGLPGTRIISCPDFIFPAPNRLDIDGQIGQSGYVVPVSVLVTTAGGPGNGYGQAGLAGNGGTPVMYGAGGGGTAGQNGTNGIVVISW